MKKFSFLIYSFLFLFCWSCGNTTAKQDDSTPTAEKPKAAMPNAELSKPLVFVGTYTRNEGHVDGKGEGIYIYEMEPTTGALDSVGVFPGPINPSYLTVHPNGQYLYAVNEHMGDGDFPTGTVTAFSIDRANKQLNLLNVVSAEGGAPCYLDVVAKGKYVAVANYVGGNIALLPILADGSLGKATATMQHTGKGTHPRQGAAHAHMITPGRIGLYAVDLGTNKITQYGIPAGKDKLRFISEVEALPGAGPRQLVFHPTKSDLAYAVCELNGTVEAYTVDKIGQLSRFQSIATTKESIGDLAACADIRITPDGKFLYASNRGASNSLAMYRIDQTDGKLNFLGTTATKGEVPRNFVIDPSGKFLLVANQNSDNVVTFKINSTSGLLEDIGIESQIKTPVCLDFLMP